jgi:hypothetical protein
MISINSPQKENVRNLIFQYGDIDKDTLLPVSYLGCYQDSVKGGNAYETLHYWNKEFS